jgi:uncharacterized protein
MNKYDLIKHLSLVEHIEGGYFSETYRSDCIMSTEREGNERNILTSIYYLLTDERPIDYFHKNKSDIMHYFQAGSAITYLIIDPLGNLNKVKLGLDFTQGEVAQLLVPRDYWKAAILEAGEFGLLGESVAPGFDYRDMEIAQPHHFREQFGNLWEQLAPYVKNN